MGEDQDRIDELEVAAMADHDRIDELEAAAVADQRRIDELEVAALLDDARIVELVKEIEHLQTAREHAGVINQAKGVLMASMHIGPDAAFAVLVAASQRENVKLRDVARRIADSQDEV